MISTLGLALILSQSVVGWQEPGEVVIGPPPGPAVVANDPMTDLLVRLQKSPSWRDRKDAAITLRHGDWRGRPEILGALTFSLQNDPDRRVRAEVAESFAKMAPADQGVVQALIRASADDPDLGTRIWARRAVRNIEGKPGVGLIGKIFNKATHPLQTVRNVVMKPVYVEPILLPEVTVGPVIVGPVLPPPVMTDVPAAEPLPDPTFIPPSGTRPEPALTAPNRPTPSSVDSSVGPAAAADELAPIPPPATGPGPALSPPSSVVPDAPATPTAEPAPKSASRRPSKRTKVIKLVLPGDSRSSSGK